MAASFATKTRSEPEYPSVSVAISSMLAARWSRSGVSTRRKIVARADTDGKGTRTRFSSRRSMAASRSHGRFDAHNRNTFAFGSLASPSI